MSERKSSYADFWPFYLREHGKARTRYLHFLGTGLALILLVAGFFLRLPGFIILALFCGYFFAWIGHFFVEKNRPATFTHPLWSLLSDFRMFFLWVTGNLAEELEKAGVEDD